MDYIFDEWKKVLENFQNSVSKDLEEIHKQKDAVQQMKTDIFDHLDSGRYITDDERIVISAPEIVIGNVDKSGMLKGSGKVIIRGSTINVEGTGKSGTITQRAPIIQQKAVDPGIDGLEDVVYPNSAIISQARAITLESSDSKDAFSEEPAILGESGIRIHADKTLQVEAATSADHHKENVEKRLEALKEQKDELKKRSDNSKKDIDKFFKDLKKLMDQEEDLNGSNDLIRVKMLDMEKIRIEVENITPALYRATSDFVQAVSRMAEVSRQITALETEKNAIKTGDAFQKESTGASLSLIGESIDILNRDGDGMLRTNPGAGINVHTPRMSIGMEKEDGTLVEDSSFDLTSQYVTIDTGNANKDGSQVSATGSVAILSKEISLEAMDYEKKDEEYNEKGLAANGKISIAAKTIEVSAASPSGVEHDDDGHVKKGSYKAEGDIIMKSKNITMETVDYDVDGGNAKTKAVAQGSKLLLLAETITAGKEGDDFKSKKIDAMASEDITLKGEKTFTAQQGDDKASVKLADGKMNLSSGGNEVKGKTEFKDAVNGTELTMNKVEVKQSFKSMNIKDGM
jgi:hypothetical protein